ncbi:SAM-dependent methyltransferase [Aquitalea sp. S1-19]|nr:SAM-dependent methyltransferase [Aquitalea sp. S1-19]
MAQSYEIKPEQSLELLKELHILTRDGKLNQDSRRKLKQVYHLVQFIEPLIREVVEQKGDVTIVDHGAGKSYLGFILYDLVLKALNVGEVIGIETRDELVKTTAALAERLGFARMRFINETVAESISDSAIGKQVDIVTALHACNTATDDAIRFALEKDAQFIVLVPCCQAEVAAELRQVKAKLLAGTPLAELVRHGIHTREFGSQLTNVLRCLLLESHGYQLTVTELVGWEHSMKNELIVARKGHKRGGARERAESIVDTFMLGNLKARFIY